MPLSPDGRIEVRPSRETPVDGTSAMKRAIREKVLRDNALDYPVEQIVAA